MKGTRSNAPAKSPDRVGRLVLPLVLGIGAPVTYAFSLVEVLLLEPLPALRTVAVSENQPTSNIRGWSDVPTGPC